MSGIMLVLGGSGFHGRAVVCHAVRSGHWDKVVSASRRPHRTHPGADVTIVDTASHDLAELLDRVDCVVNAAHQVRGDQEALLGTNVLGVSRVAQHCHRAGVRRLVEIGTAAVYGHRVLAGAREGEVTPAPSSATSATRLRGETVALEVGGVVVRPHYVVGAGDRWVVPTLHGALSSPAWPSRPKGRVSILNVADLARAVVALAVGDDLRGTVVHAGVPGGVAVTDLANMIRDMGLPDATPPELPAPMVTGLADLDASLACDMLWELPGTGPAPGITDLFRAADVAWYRNNQP